MASDHGHADPLQHPEVQQANATGYVVGFALSIAFMLAALIITAQHAFGGFLPRLEAVSGLAFVALLAQCALFFGLDLSREQIWKTVSLVFTVPLFVLSIGLTVWMFHTLYLRTTLPAVLHHPGLLQ
jgi:cytochrome o ubiquinol oxidase operon protein cyoD